ncbi:MAG: hypothetical protein WCK09_18995 [Bacteroidota bacterium]
MRSKHISSDNNALPLSSLVPDPEKNDLASTGDEEPLSNFHESEQDDLTRTLAQHADHAKTEVNAYMKLLDELKKMANQKP